MGTCMYRGRAGLRCAIGVLIDDKDYVPSMEGLDICSVIDSYTGLSGTVLRNVDRGLLKKLQLLHDTWPADSWEAQLSEIEKKL